MTVRFDPASPQRFRDAVSTVFGLAFDDGRLAFLGEVMKRRADARREPVEAYLALLEGGPPRAELGPLAEELTVGETYFFRNSDQFRALEEVALPARLKVRGAEKRLSILSAACSSGEEAYSLAVVARELVDPSWTVAIRAVDLNPAALARAEAGRYSSWSLRETPPEVIARWFIQQGRSFVLDREIRDAVTFEQRNLAVDDPDLWREGAYDIVFCRNVIMYFKPAVQQQVIGRIVRALAPGGYLFLGHAETLRGLSPDFHLVHTHGTFYYQRKGDLELETPRPVVVARTNGAASRAEVPSIVPGDTSWFEAIGNASKRIDALLRPAAAASEPVAAPAIPTWSLAGALDLMQRERFSEALDAIGAMPQEAAGDPDVMLLRAMLLAQGGKLAAAVEVCRELLLTDELNAGANYVLGLCFEAAGDPDGAERHYRAAGYLDPLFAMPFLHLGLMLRRAGKRTAARAELEQAMDLLRREDGSRLLLFGGGFTRDGLLRLCEAELRACEAQR